MDIVVYRSGKPWSTPFEDAFVSGLKAHGHDPHYRSLGDWRVAELSVIWGHRATPLFDMQRDAGTNYLIMERGYVGDRTRWTSLGLNGLNGRATFPNPRDADRWRKTITLRPWSRGGGYALVIGQVQGDAAVESVNLDLWYSMVTGRIATTTGLPVKFWPHPVSVERGQVAPVPGAETLPGSLEKALHGAAVVATYNSNSAVDAVIAGVPTWAMDEGSMAWSITGHDLDEQPPTPDRTEWANWIAHTQWSEAEIRDGIAWDHLREVM